MSASSENSKWIISKVCVIDLESKKKAVVTIYGFARKEMSLSSISLVDSSKSGWYESFNRVVYLTGSGTTFVMPDTRLQLNVEAFFERRLDSFVEKKHTPAYYRMGVVSEMDNKQKLICQVSKQGSESIIDVFTYLTNEQVKERKRKVEKTIGKKLNVKKSDSSPAPESSIEKLKNDNSVIIKGKYGVSEVRKVKAPAGISKESKSVNEMGGSWSADGIPDPNDLVKVTPPPEDTSDDSSSEDEKPKNSSKSEEEIESEVRLLDFIKAKDSTLESIMIKKAKYVTLTQKLDAVPDIYINREEKVFNFINDVVDVIRYKADNPAGTLDYYPKCNVTKGNSIKTSNGGSISILLY